MTLASFLADMEAIRAERAQRLHLSRTVDDLKRDKADTSKIGYRCIGRGELRCRCINLWLDESGNYWCCTPTAALGTHAARRDTDAAADALTHDTSSSTPTSIGVGVEHGEQSEASERAG